jgi:prevent-host-death family protein
LSSLLERVAKGERFTITRHGKPVAQLLPVERHDPARVEAAIARMKEISAGVTLNSSSTQLSRPRDLPMRQAPQAVPCTIA